MKNKFFEKENELTIKDNDIYILERTKDKIIINNNYQGLIFLNYNLEKIKNLNLFEGLLIYSIFQKKIDNELLLYCPENNCLIFIDLNSYKYKITRLDGFFEKVVFSPLFFWEDEIMLTDYNQNFYRISIIDAQIYKIE